MVNVSDIERTNTRAPIQMQTSSTAGLIDIRRGKNNDTGNDRSKGWAPGRR